MAYVCSSDPSWVVVSVGVVGSPTAQSGQTSDSFAYSLSRHSSSWQ